MFDIETLIIRQKEEEIILGFKTRNHKERAKSFIEELKEYFEYFEENEDYINDFCEDYNIAKKDFIDNIEEYEEMSIELACNLLDKSNIPFEYLPSYDTIEIYD